MNKSLYPWHNKVWQQLCRAMQAQSVPHALLLQGPAQTGKLTFARHFAVSLLCQQPSTQGNCGYCQSCLLHQAGNHPDFIELLAEQGSIKVDQIRALATQLQGSRHSLGYRVIIINHAECMNAAAANSLLKTLEEPPEKTVILLVTAQPGRLLATIRSRCQQFSLQPAKADVLAWLSQQQLQLTEAQVIKRYQLLGHAPLLLVDDEYFERYVEAFDQWLSVLEGQPVRYGVKPSGLINQLTDWSRLCNWLMKVALGAQLDLDQALRRRLINSAKRIKPQALSSFYNELQMSIKLLGEHNSLNETLLLDGHWVSWRNLVVK
ncbi:DNA polymerase III subunit delta' [Piscirickettsia litoralis]|uniref:DNA-directed DNA polymerase n=1 Tax=Piscirickettsia litoralis TaxID=1891921 RepID=A0ABX3A6N3_9GAMM|nr:DNA polymerase III subunit delta' [Piscirickettsia litoralis]ODN43298.1 DNA polymerase III subunit delta' [Piscirickettsia litoralis]